MKQPFLKLLFLLIFLIPASLLAVASSRTYTYDNVGRLERVDHSNGIAEIYTYDVMGNRKSKVVTVPTDIDTDGDGIPDLTDACPFSPNDSVGDPCNHEEEGDLNRNFSADGKVTTDLGGNDFATGALIQPDGKIIVAGHTDSVGDFADFDFALVRYNADGTPDSSFGAGGKLVTPIGPDSNFVTDLLLQVDGKIVVVGNGGGDFVLARYTADGVLDPTFDQDGIVTTDLGAADSANEIALLHDGKLLVAGETNRNGGEDFALVRYFSDGSLDRNFGTDGVVVTPVSNNADIPYAMVIQGDGKIVVGGFVYDDQGIHHFGLVRYNADGTLDTTFDPVENDGKVTTSLSSNKDGLYAMGLQSDGKIIAGGYTFDGLNYDFALVRYNTDGGLDTSFGGTNGIVTTDFGFGDGSALGDFINDIIIRDDDKILAIGMVANNFAVARFNANGTLDTTYANSGSVIIDMGGVDGAFGAYADNGMMALGGSSDGNFGAALLWGPKADLGVEMGGAPGAQSLPGGKSVMTMPASLTLTATNNGPDSAIGVRLTLTLSTGSTFLNAQPSQGVCLNDTPEKMTCRLGMLEKGEKATITIPVNVDNYETFEATATINGRVTDLNPENNQAVTGLKNQGKDVDKGKEEKKDLGQQGLDNENGLADEKPLPAQGQPGIGSGGCSLLINH